MQVYLTGLFLGFSLIVAIGAQNAFVLRQGLKREHVFPVCLMCALSDAVLIGFGVTGFRTLNEQFVWLEPLLRYGGTAFLVWYGATSLRSALKSSSSLLVEDDQVGVKSTAELAAPPLGKTLILCLALTWLNPHVYLDTVVMLGVLAAGYPGQEKIFAAGAISASFIFFFALGYGAALLRPIFAKPLTWRIFESAIALLMWFLAAKLLLA